MPRALILAVLLAATPAAPPSAAQDFTGTYSVAGAQGAVTLTLRQDGRGQLTGSLAGNGASYQVQGYLADGGAVGMITGDGMGLYFEARLTGGQLHLTLVESGAAGEPNYATARQLVLARTGGAGGGASPGMAQQRGGASSPAGGGSAQDRQLAQLLSSSAWCSFSYNQTTGNTSTERVVMRPDGSGHLGSQSETVQYNDAGSYGGASSSGGGFRWRVQGGSLYLSQDGAQWAGQPIQVSRNSSGSPIVTSGGKEYAMCN